MRDLKFIRFVVNKYLKFDKTQPFITVSFVLAFLGITIGVAVLILAMAILNGMDKEFQEKLTVMNYPLTLKGNFDGAITDDTIRQLEKKHPNFHFSPFVQTSAIVKKEDMNGILLYGVDFEKESVINPILKKAIEGKKEFGIFDTVIGKRLFDEMELTPDEKVLFYFSKSGAYGLNVAPRVKKTKIISAFSSGLIAYDKGIAYMNIEGLKRILNKQHYSGVHIYTKTPFEDIKLLEKELPFGTRVFGWWEQNGNFFVALKLEKQVMFLVLMLIIIVAALNIIGSLLMMIMNRRKEIALMLSLGASEKEIKAIFFRLGLTVGIIGIIVGSLLGFSGIWFLENYDLIELPEDVYGTTKVPTDLSLIDFLSVIGGAFVVVMITSWYPAKKASEVNILNTLRFE